MYFYTSLVRPPFNCTSVYQRTTGDASTAQRLKGSLQLESATAYNPNSRPQSVQFGGASTVPCCRERGFVVLTLYTVQIAPL